MLSMGCSLRSSSLVHVFFLWCTRAAQRGRLSALQCSPGTCNFGVVHFHCEADLRQAVPGQILCSSSNGKERTQVFHMRHRQAVAKPPESPPGTERSVWSTSRTEVHLRHHQEQAPRETPAGRINRPEHLREHLRTLHTSTEHRPLDVQCLRAGSYTTRCCSYAGM